MGVGLLGDLFLARGHRDNVGLLLVDFSFKHALVLLNVADVVFVDLEVRCAFAAPTLSNLCHKLFPILVSNHFALG